MVSYQGRPLEIGKKFQNYEILAVIGEGGHAVVYHGRRAFLGQDVAIKVLIKLGDDAQRRAQNEAVFLKGFKHPNVVEVFDADRTDDGLVYIVMEFLSGRTLEAAWRSTGASPWPRRSTPSRRLRRASPRPTSTRRRSSTGI